MAKSSRRCNKSFCSNYMLLKPEECGVLDLARILFSSNKNMGQKEFVDCPNEQMTKELFPHRWIIFISILVQKLFLAAAEPLARFGNAIEYWLNLQNVNGGFFCLLFNSLRGKVVVPDKESAAFLSFIGNLDKRVELDINKSVEVGSRRYVEAISMMAAKAAYENKAYIETAVKDHWKICSMASSRRCNKSFCRNYMLLKPEECGVLDLARIVFSSNKNMGQKEFVDCPDEEMTEEPFSRRWVIFISILVQKILLATAKPLAGFGNAIEYWLNLQNVNGGFFRLVFNSIRGKAVVPDKESAAYLSFIGNLDKRVELDNSKSVEEVGGRRRYDEAISMMAAKAAYENKAYIETTVKDHWKAELLFLVPEEIDFDYQQKATTQAFVLQDKNVDPELIVVAFRGTEFFSSDDWISNFDLSWYEISDMGKVHAGFMKALGLQKSLGWPKDIVQTDTNNQPSPAYYFLRKLLKQLLEKNEKARFVVTGHSLGGALAILFPAILAFHEESWLLKRLAGVYTFGQPRVGDENFVEYMKGQLAKHEVPYYRVVYSNDMVPRLPYDNSTFMFKHFGTCIYYNSLYNEKILDEEPNKNGLAPLLFIPKMLNAGWELIRSFILPFVIGRKYEEGGLLFLMRVVGLLLPGVPAHCPQDYVNSTRLGDYATTENVAKYQNIGTIKN
ncbi:hypothetical protein HAX54_043880 [Datura stramonium]|uniref:Fungal lipase-type domain-containing protein n=1 Tax=Datura stramonium TaxID=4076 RepID=A0ABS8SP76_DATST|nr:hypothetical protein [Datura stramonium]